MADLRRAVRAVAGGGVAEGRGAVVVVGPRVALVADLRRAVGAVAGGGVAEGRGAVVDDGSRVTLVADLRRPRHALPKCRGLLIHGAGLTSTQVRVWGTGVGR